MLGSRYFTPIYKVKTASVKRNVKLLFPVVHFFEASLAYLKIDLHLASGPIPLGKSRFVPNFQTPREKNVLFFGCNCRYSIPHEMPVVQNIKWHLMF